MKKPLAIRILVLLCFVGSICWFVAYRSGIQQIHNATAGAIAMNTVIDTPGTNSSTNLDDMDSLERIEFDKNMLLMGSSKSMQVFDPRQAQKTGTKKKKAKSAAKKSHP